MAQFPQFFDFQGKVWQQCHVWWNIPQDWDWKMFNMPSEEVNRYIQLLFLIIGRCGGLVVSALVSGSSGPGSSPGRGHCIMLLGKTQCKEAWRKRHNARRHNASWGLMVCKHASVSSGPGSSSGRGCCVVSWARHFILTAPLSTKVYIWVLVNLMLGVTLWSTSILSRG